MAKLDRRSVLGGALVGILAGGGIGFVSGALSEKGAVSGAVEPFEADGRKPSYSQQGEDLVVKNMLDMLQITQPRYLDIGAHHPSINSNTFLFYKTGGRGVLVEPNPTYAALLRERRPEDKVVEVGIGVTSATEADYYVIAGDGQRNTFSKEQADELVRLNGRGALVKVIKLPLVNVNELISQHFPAGAPDFVSIDVEGLDLAILETFDFARFRPKVFCVETSMLDGDVHKGIVELMASKEYEVRGGSFVNTVFLDRRALRALVEKTRDAGS